MPVATPIDRDIGLTNPFYQRAEFENVVRKHFLDSILASGGITKITDTLAKAGITKLSSFGIASPITKKKLVRFKIDKEPTYWEEKSSGFIAEGGKVRSIGSQKAFGLGEKKTAQRGYRLHGYSPETKTWEWVDTLKNPIEAEKALRKWNRALVKGSF